MPDNIAVKKVTVADPEIGFSVILDRAGIAAEKGISVSQLKISGITVQIEITHDNDFSKVYSAIVGVGRTVKYGVGTLEEVVNDEFDFIYPFLDPEFKDAKVFHYTISVTVNSMVRNENDPNKIPYPVIPTQTFKGSQKFLGETYLKPYIDKGNFGFRDLALRHDDRKDNKIIVNNVIAGKAGIGAQIHWGANLRVMAARIFVGFDGGKSTVGFGLRDSQNPAKFSPINVFIPYPRGVDHKEDFDYTFGVELMDIDSNGQYFVLPMTREQVEIEHPAPVKDTQTTLNTSGWDEIEITHQQLASTFPDAWQSNFNKYESVKLAAFNRWAAKNNYKLCIPVTASPINGFWKVLAHNPTSDFKWANFPITQLTYTYSKWPAEDPEVLASKVFNTVHGLNQNNAAWPSWEVGTKNGQTALGVFVFPSNLASASLKLSNQIKIDPTKGILFNIEQVMKEAKRLGYKGGIVRNFSYNGLQPIYAFK